MTLYAMDRDTYRHILMGSVLKKRQLYDDVLKKVKVLSELYGFASLYCLLLVDHESFCVIMFVGVFPSRLFGLVSAT